MSKRALKKYLNTLEKEQLEEQLLDLYDRFKPVQVYYNFVFNPKEDKLVEEAKFKIGKEYFPAGRRKPKARRSVAQKHIKHFLTLGVEPALVADIMLYNLEIAQTYCARKPVRQDSFYQSMLNSFEQAVTYLKAEGILTDFKPRIAAILEATYQQEWLNTEGFDRVWDEVAPTDF